jgi:hypothetical protein
MAMRGRTIYIDKEVEVEVSLEDFDTDDLMEELAQRDMVLGHSAHDLLLKIYEARRLGLDYQQHLDQLIWDQLGRIA